MPPQPVKEDIDTTCVPLPPEPTRWQRKTDVR